MDPITISRLAHIRQQEILEWAADQGRESAIEELLWKLGESFMAVGRKIVSAANFVRTDRATALTVAIEHGEYECRGTNPCVE